MSRIDGTGPGRRGVPPRRTRRGNDASGNLALSHHEDTLRSTSTSSTTLNPIDQMEIEADVNFGDFDESSLAPDHLGNEIKRRRTSLTTSTRPRRDRGRIRVPADIEPGTAPRRRCVSPGHNLSRVLQRLTLEIDNCLDEEEQSGVNPSLQSAPFTESCVTSTTTRTTSSTEESSVASSAHSCDHHGREQSH